MHYILDFSKHLSQSKHFSADGVVEATNKANEMYGNDRLKACLDAHADEDAKAICQAVREDVDVFYDGGEQFDDITELSLQLKKYSTM